MAELQTRKFKSLFSWKNAYYTIYTINFDSKSLAQFFYPSHWTPGKNPEYTDEQKPFCSSY